MSHRFFPGFSACAAALLLALAIPQSPAFLAHWPGRADGQACGFGQSGVRMSRTELFFGLSRRGGAIVTDAELERFIETQVSPRLPEGFTIVAGNGQFRDASGAVVREPARVLVVLYPLDDHRRSASLETIRAEYKQAFDQESVLRVDAESCAFS